MLIVILELSDQDILQGDLLEVFRHLVIVSMPGQPIDLLLLGLHRFRYILLLARSLRLHDVSRLLHETLS